MHHLRTLAGYLKGSPVHLQVVGFELLTDFGVEILAKLPTRRQHSVKVCLGGRSILRLLLVK